MQHLGTFIFMLMHRDIGLWMVEPVRFQAALWSKGTGNIYEVNFGRTSDIQKKVETYQMYSWDFNSEHYQQGN